MDKETDFGWALDKMRDGYQVRRKEWPVCSEHGDCFLELVDGVLFLRGDHGFEVQSVTVPTEDVLAYDWELVA
jgi:hypothetical protein